MHSISVTWIISINLFPVPKIFSHVSKDENAIIMNVPPIHFQGPPHPPLLAA